MDDLFLKFQDHLKQHGWENKKILVAVSGGLDSMTLAVLLHRSRVVMEIAHCNFGLRGAESDGDEALVRKWAEERNIPLHVQRFDTLKILKEQGGNLEETARNLRYEWFESLRKVLHFDFIAVAHHRQDSMETLLINFFKGTGMAGLHGILPERGKIIRPLLLFSKDDFKDYAAMYQIPWREDSSNLQNDYLRNRIRHQLLPEIELVFPDVKNALEGNIQRFQEAEILFREAVEHYRKRLLEKRKEDFYISVLKLKKCKALTTVLFELIKPFGFVAAQMPDVLHLLETESGKWVAGKEYRILRDRQFLILTQSETQKSTFISIAKPEGELELDFQQGQLVLERIVSDKKILFRQKKTNDEEWLALEDVDFPLTLRPLRDGDYFYPLGMGGKKKKVGKFLRDLKIPLHEKEKVWILESHKKIIWVVGFRMDERFKIQEKGAAVWHFSFKKDNVATK